MTLLVLEALPHKTTRGTIVRMLIQLGGIDRQRIGRIELTDRAATVDVPDSWGPRLVKQLDGASLDNRHIRVSLRAERPVGQTGGEDHFDRLMRLLDLEAEAEAAQAREYIRKVAPAEAERQGMSLINLVLVDVEAGLGGRFLAKLARADRERLPWTRLGVGSPVLLSELSAQRPSGWRGVVSERTDSAIQIAMNQPPEPDDDVRLRLDLFADEVARDRQRAALERARTAAGERLAELREVLLASRPPRFADEADYRPLDASLNLSQQEAVRHALAAEDLAVIHGPPGTGKTTTVVELIRQAVACGQKVLACAPSNMAVDNIFERLLRARVKAVRIGHPARVLPELRRHTLDLVVAAHPDVRLARKLFREANSLRDKAARYTRAKPAPGAKREMREEARQLVQDARRIERQVVAEVLNGADVICSTTTAIDSEVLGQREFDLAVIDECCQSTEPGCWIPLLRSGRVVLAGDHCQLPPTVVSKEAVREGFGVSLLERVVAEYGSDVCRRLTVQYRMHEQIMGFSSAEFYDDELVADPAVRTHLLTDLPVVTSEPLTDAPLTFIDTAGAGYDEEREENGESRLNRQEAELVLAQVDRLLQAGVTAADIAVITPYSAQVRLLRDRLADSPVEINSVDGFQGREKEAVIISLVRSNPTGEIGFLADVRRMNVALTRARRKLIVIGDSATIGSHSFYARLLEYFEQQTAYTTVWAEM